MARPIKQFNQRKWSHFKVFFEFLSFLNIANKDNLLSITFFAEIKTTQEKSIKSMKIDTDNFLGDRFSSISDINQLINIDYIDYWF